VELLLGMINTIGNAEGTAAWAALANEIPFLHCLVVSPVIAKVSCTHCYLSHRLADSVALLTRIVEPTLARLGLQVPVATPLGVVRHFDRACDPGDDSLCQDQYQGTANAAAADR
jgi:hypothetical protein